jgi:hypothetical protein
MNRTFTAAVVLSATVLGLAACGGADAAGTSSGGTSSGQPAGATGTSAPASSGQGRAIDVCAALPASAATQITGATFTTAKPKNVEHVIFGCEYTGPDAVLLQISVAVQAGRLGFNADVRALKAVHHPPNRVSGVGDEAFSEPDPHGNAGSVGAAAFASYGAVFGDTYIKIGGLTYVTADQGKQIVELLHSKQAS